jgi:hypothetical protein
VGMNGNVCASPAVGTNGTPRGGGSQSQQQVVGGSSGSHGKLLQPKRLVQRPTVGSMSSEDVLLHACRVLPSSSNTEGPLGSGVHAGGSGSNAGVCMLRSCGTALFHSLLTITAVKGTLGHCLHAHCNVHIPWWHKLLGSVGPGLGLSLRSYVMMQGTCLPRTAQSPRVPVQWQHVAVSAPTHLLQSLLRGRVPPCRAMWSMVLCRIREMQSRWMTSLMASWR